MNPVLLDQSIAQLNYLLVQLYNFLVHPSHILIKSIDQFGQLSQQVYKLDFSFPIRKIGKVRIWYERNHFKEKDQIRGK